MCIYRHIFLDGCHFQQVLKGIHNPKGWDPLTWTIFLPAWQKMPGLIICAKMSNGKPTRAKAPWHYLLTEARYSVQRRSRGSLSSPRKSDDAPQALFGFFQIEHKRKKSGALVSSQESFGCESRRHFLVWKLPSEQEPAEREAILIPTPPPVLEAWGGGPRGHALRA